MSKDIVVLTPAGRRQIVHVTPDTTMLQILEDVCTKQGFQPTQYDLKHHNKIIDLTNTIRFSNLPNKATLEMVEVERQREEVNVTVGLQLEDGERRTADFPPNTCLFDLLTSLAPNEIKALPHPTIMYMRQEVIGVLALKEKTLRQLGLIGGRAVLRLLNKVAEGKQANVSSVYRKLPVAKPEKEQIGTTITDDTFADNKPGPSGFPNQRNLFNPTEAIKGLKKPEESKQFETKPNDSLPKTNTDVAQSTNNQDIPMEARTTESVNKLGHSEPVKNLADSCSSSSLETQCQLERRLTIEEEVTFLGAQRAIAFMPTDSHSELTDLPDDFYELTIEEVRSLYRDLQQHRSELENPPFITAAQREEIDRQASEVRLSGYKNVVVRVQFPDQIILQGVFTPANTIQDVMNFIKQHLEQPDKPFLIFTTPFKESLDPTKTLLQAKFVPCVHLHFKWLNDTGSQICLKEEIYEKQTSSDAACILASKYRAPSRRKLDDPSSSNKASSGKVSKMPKWFKT